MNSGQNRFLLVAAVALFSAGCDSSLGLSFGETLCDDDRPCEEGFTCVSGVCVDGATASIDDGEDELPPWPEANEPQPDPLELERCRVDEQCGLGQVCFEGQCIDDACGDLECPDGTACRPRCRPTPSACDGVECTPGVTYCLDGACVPLCANDLCLLNGCFPDTEGCEPVVDPEEGAPTHLCTGQVEAPQCDETGCDFVLVDSTCQSGRCVPVLEATISCDDRACPGGNECVVDCLPPDPCNPNPCNNGWSCQDLGDAGYTCIPLTCSGVSCPEGEICLNGTCSDPCASQPCEFGGDLCCTDVAFDDDPDPSDPDFRTASEKLTECQARSTCCNRTCCPYDFECVDGACVPPVLACDPTCEDDEICLTDGCSCGPQTETGPVQCAEDACCLADLDLTDDVAVDPGCVDDPCTRPSGPGGQSGAEFCLENDPVNKGCEKDCTQESGFRCVDLCTGVSCEAPDTCDPATGRCSCGGERCESDECCIAETCTPVCDGQCADPEDGLCETRCEQNPVFECVDQCPMSCTTRNPDCDPKVGDCVCFAAGRACGNNQCCTGTGCENPCNTTLAETTCGELACEVACDEPNGFRCVDRCLGTDCAAQNPANPVCIPSSGACLCEPGEAPCNGAECCVGGTCVSVCEEADPCPLAGAPNDRECVSDCSVPEGFRCENFCDGVTCGTGLSCDPLDGLCKCPGDLGDGGAPDCSGSSRCCSGPGNTCDTDPCSGGACESGGTTGTNFDCNVDCSQPDGFRCDDFCEGINCDTSQGRLPFRVCDPMDGRCKCEGFVDGDPQCRRGDECCTGELSGALTCERGVCGPNPCARENDAEAFADAGNFPNTFTGCRRDCDRLSSDGTEVLGYECFDQCAGVTCSVAGASCGVDDGSCRCGGDGGDECTGANACCDGTTCDPNPCAGNPCGSSGLCEVDCSAPDNFVCVDQCVAQSRVCGDQPNPDCNPVNAQCQCGTPGGGFNTCNGSQCCLSNSCDNPCNPNPCNSGNNRVCNRDCDEPGGFVCTSFCDTPAGQACGDTPGVLCDPVQQRCECGGAEFDVDNPNLCCIADSPVDPCVANPCGDGEGACVRDCSQPLGRICVDQCAPTACGEQPNPDCRPSDAACRCETGGTYDECVGDECCLDAGCSDPCAAADACPKGSDDPNALRCNPDCAAPDGYFCDDACEASNACEGTLDNPLCDGSDGSCFCEPDGTSCNGEQICCFTATQVIDNECRIPNTDACPNPLCTRDACSGTCSGPEGVDCG